MYYPNQEIAGNKVYKEYIRDRNHAHMNSTKWATLMEFLKVLWFNAVLRGKGNFGGERGRIGPYGDLYR